MSVFKIFVVGCLLFTSTAALANNGAANCDATNEMDSLPLPPKVFILGEHEAAFEQLSMNYSIMLLEACDNDMKVAYGKWLDMLQQMEVHSEKMDYDLKAIKVWFNIFWDKSGAIDHIAYYLKPASKNIDTERMTLFLISFMNNYTFPLEYHGNYAHYGSASFPTMPRRLKVEKKKTHGTRLAKDQINSSNGSRRE